MQVRSENYDDNPHKLMVYKDMSSSIQTGMLFLNPVGTIEDGHIRVVLSWGQVGSLLLTVACYLLLYRHTECCRASELVPSINLFAFG